MGYTVNKLQLYSMDDNKKYAIDLPNENIEMLDKFKNILFEINNFDFENFTQINSLKCQNCIYEPYCDRSILI